MCVDGDILDSGIWENYETNMFFIFFLCGFTIKASIMHKHVINNQEHVKNAYEHLRTFKHIQGIEIKTLARSNPNLIIII